MNSSHPVAAESITNTPLTLKDGWVKATDSGMTSAFGRIQNNTGTAVTLVSFESDVSPQTELHETIHDGNQGMMQERPEGFTIQPDEMLILEPGGNHLMLMAVTEELVPGMEIELKLNFSDGNILTAAFPVKEFAGANETYDGGDHNEHSQDDHEHDHAE